MALKTSCNSAKSRTIITVFKFTYAWKISFIDLLKIEIKLLSKKLPK
jgi:hypothetical protein